MAEADDQPHIKGIRFMGGSRKALVDLSPEVRKSFGHGIREAQNGLKPTAAKPLPQFGSRVFELIKDYDKDTFRCNIYVSKNFVYILAPYMKKSKKGKEIPAEILTLTSERLAKAKELEAFEQITL